MLKLETRVHVDGLTAEEIFDFLTNPTDPAYQAWWPGVHLHLRLLERRAGHVGDVLYMDEYVGRRRLRLRGVVLEAAPGRRLVWQFKRVVRLPARLSLEFAERDAGVDITHTLEAGFSRFPRLQRPLLRLYFTNEFAGALDEHVRTEFPLLRDRSAQIREARGHLPEPVGAASPDLVTAVTNGHAAEHEGRR